MCIHCVRAQSSIGRYSSIVNVEEDALFHGGLKGDSHEEEAVTYVDKVRSQTNAHREELAA